MDEVIARWDAFWRGANPRPLVAAINPKPGVEPRPRPNCYRLTFGEFAPVIDEVLAWAETHEFVGDAIPSYQVSFAADHFAALLGAEVRAHPDSPETLWLEPFVEDWDSTEIRFQREGYWWERTVACIRAFRQRCDGRLLVFGTHLEGGLDALSAIRGPQPLVMDLLDRPEAVLRAARAVDRALSEVRAALAEELDVAAWGAMNRFGMYSATNIDVPQCDFSCMISPAMFAEFELPSLRHEVAGVGHSIYHLDGPDALQHLDAVCGVAGLDMIQWQPGAGNFDRDWTWVYDRVDALGKGQFWWTGGAAALPVIRERWHKYQSRQQYYSFSGLPTADLLAFLDELERG